MCSNRYPPYLLLLVNQTISGQTYRMVREIRGGMSATAIRISTHR